MIKTGEIFSIKTGEGPTGIDPVDKILVGIFGVGGMLTIAILAGIGIWKAPIPKEFTASKAFQSTKKLVLGIKLFWDTLEPYIRKNYPNMKEKFYWIDQGLDFAQSFVSLDTLTNLLRDDRSGY